jgi:glycosyltransferase involved in cell wall biosynthesis
MSVRVPIAVWLSSFGAGGTERQMVHLIRGLDRDRFSVHAACFDARGQWLDAAGSSAVEIAEFPIRGFFRPNTWRQLRRYADWCRSRRIVAVITSDFYTNIFGLTGAALAGVPVRIGGRREIVTDKSTAKLVLQRAAYGLAHAVVANSSAAAARLRREGVPSRSIHIVSNGVDLPASAPRHRAIIRRAVCVANLRPEKGHDVLIDALAARPDLRNLQVEFVGDGPCRPALEAHARARGIEQQVRFLGERHDVEERLADADLFVLASRTEALPNSVMEAMAAGLPVVACRIGGIPELVDDGATGLLVPPDDSDALAGAIARLVADPAFASALGTAARAAIAQRFSMPGMIVGFTDILFEQLSRRKLEVGGRTPELGGKPGVRSAPL